MQDTEVKPVPVPPHAHVRIWYWRPSGADSLLCPLREAPAQKRQLIASGAVVWHSEVLGA